MSKISFRDIIDLAKAGYKPSDVKELIQMAETSSSSSSDNTAQADAAPETKSGAEQSEEKEENKEVSSSTESADEDKKIADLEAKIVDLTEKLSKAQSDNVRSDMADASDEKDAATILSELATSFM